MRGLGGAGGVKISPAVSGAGELELASSTVAVKIGHTARAKQVSRFMF